LSDGKAILDKKHVRNLDVSGIFIVDKVTQEKACEK